MVVLVLVLLFRLAGGDSSRFIRSSLLDLGFDGGVVVSVTSSGG
jgi:hypothetical protein